MQLQTTARALELPLESVLAVSAKQALLARIRGDTALLARSGIETLERMLADEVVPAKQQIMRAAIEREIGSMMEGSRRAIVTQFNALRDEYKSLGELTGKNRSVATQMLARLESDRKSYRELVARYRESVAVVKQRSDALLASLSDAALDQLINKDRQYIEDAWSTAGLIRNMQGLFAHFTLQSDRILKFSKEILALVEESYAQFQAKVGFEKLIPPALNLEQYTLAIHQLKQITIEYCHHPKQILTEKHFLVSRFYASLVAEARDVFESTRSETESWLRAALHPLEMAMREYTAQLDKRVENLKKLQDHLHSVGSRSKQLEREILTLKAQHEVLAAIKRNLSEVEVPVQNDAVAPDAVPANDPALACASRAA
jgi:hypothetical protein